MLILVLGVLAAGATVLWWPDRPLRPLAEEAGRQAAAPVAAPPEPQYVDDARCAECHAEIYETYRAHPMGRSMSPIGQVSDTPDVSPDAEAFTAGGLRYEIRRPGNELIHAETYLDEEGEPIATTALPIAYAVGSGERGRSYLVNRDDRLYLSPITWYAQRGHWDLSPGYEEHNSHFNRPVIAECLFCHTNRAHPVEGTLNTYEPPIFSGHAIGCQRCHGPGEAHIALQEGNAASDARETIVNPARLEPPLREAVCQQCHLSGTARVLRRGKTRDDFRPGMPLEDIVRIFVDAGGREGTAQFVGHVEQMHASRCFTASDGRLGCISCHDPHEAPAKEARVAFYRSRCLECHAEQGCTESLDLRSAAGDDNCMVCHMPAQDTEIRHTAITDHRILRRPSEEASSAAGNAADPAPGPLVPFHTAGESAELRRDTALALLRAEDSGSVSLDEPLRKRVALDLQEAVRRHPDDLAAWDGFGMAVWRLGDLPNALRCFEMVLRQSPREEFALLNAAVVSSALGRHDRALHYWQQAFEVNPWIVRYRAELARSLASLGRWAECEVLCRQTLEHFPGSHASHQLLVESLVAQGKETEASTELEAWIRFRPADPGRLRAWFEQHPLRRSRR